MFAINQATTALIVKREVADAPVIGPLVSVYGAGMRQPDHLAPIHLGGSRV